MKDRNKKENQNSLSNSEYFPSIEIVNIAWNDADGGRVREKGLDCELCMLDGGFDSYKRGEEGVDF